MHRLDAPKLNLGLPCFLIFLQKSKLSSLITSSICSCYLICGSPRYHALHGLVGHQVILFYSTWTPSSFCCARSSAIRPPCTSSTTVSCPSPPSGASGNFFHQLHARSSATCPPCTWFTMVSCPSPPGGASDNFFHRLHERSSAICPRCTLSTTVSCPSPPGGASGNSFLLYLDSIFFLLRKKFSHLSTLHVVHHGIMPFTAWWCIR